MKRYDLAYQLHDGDLSLVSTGSATEIATHLVALSGASNTTETVERIVSELRAGATVSVGPYSAYRSIKG